MLLFACFLLESFLAFRPPAIPLFTTDPFTQTWMRGDTSTSDLVTHWTGAEKQMVGFVRVDGVNYQFLGACVPPAVTKPGPATSHLGHDISPGSCDIANFHGLSKEDCNMKCYNTKNCQAYVMSKADDKCYLKSCARPIIAESGKDGYIITGPRPSCTTKMTVQNAVTVHPTRTVFELEVSGIIALNLTFLSTMFTDDFERLSRPVYYLDVSISSASTHNIQVYFDVSAQHAVNSFDQEVEWSSWSKASMKGVQLGNSVQKVVGSKGDRVNIDWGYLHLASADQQAALWAGSADTARDAFAATGTVPAKPDKRMPRQVADDLPTLALVLDLGKIESTGSVDRTIIMAYDDVKSVNFFGNLYAGYWTQTSATIQDAISAAYAEHDAQLAKSISHDADLMSQLSKLGGDKYATLCALSYRQTLAATKLVWNSDRSTVWNFLKEISTNGDMQTMDVIYPASPMLLYTNPELLKLLLIPVLAYANNETSIKFTDPYSPHQLGTYPIANAPTSAQEPMPLENSGNMMFMLLAIIQQQEKATGKRDVSWLFPKYFDMLKRWADELVRTTEFPANQICTDDFTGKLANNTNLGAKGIIALETFSQLCNIASESYGSTARNESTNLRSAQTNCSYYSSVAHKYAQTWQKYAYTDEKGPHYKMSYNTLKDIPDSWSIKYNMLWQKILQLDGPFPWLKIVPTELSYYKTKANTYGIPMDPRHTYVKTDWLSWIAAMADNDHDFHLIFDPIYAELNDTSDRNPFTDLYDTTDAHQERLGFIARPVIGGLFAKALLSK